MSVPELIVHLFIPHQTNNHRSKVLHIDSLLVYILIFALFNFGFRVLHRQMPDILGYATDIQVEALLQDTNALRQAQGLSPLTLNSKLSEAAARKAADMFSKNYWAHNSPTGTTPWDFITASGYKYVVAGENLAKNFSTSQAVVNAWMASPTHRDNIVKPSYKEIGFAVVNGTLNGEETTLVVQMFGSSTESLAAKPVAPKAPVLVEKALATEEPAGKSAVVPPVAAPSEQSPVGNFGSEFLGVTMKPAINIPTLTRDIVFVFAGVLLGVLLIDAWVVSRRRIVRIAGHNIAHFFFLSAIVIAASTIGRGSLL
jgi:hypothetical protein